MIRLARLLRPIRWGLAGMVGLSVLLAGLIAIAIVVEAAAYVLSDGMYARNAGRLHKILRVQMFGLSRTR